MTLSILETKMINQILPDGALEEHIVWWEAGPKETRGQESTFLPLIPD